VAARLREETSGVLGGRVPALEDLARLPFNRMVVQEAMRLYPPIWIIERRVIAGDSAAGFDLPAGSAVVVAPYALHRHPGFWEAPEVFHPERFASLPPTAAYIPFGSGPRSCIGSEFAMLEAQLICAMVSQFFRMRPVPGPPAVPDPGITLRVKDGLPMILEA
jgi:cytochrome P450